MTPQHIMPLDHALSYCQAWYLPFVYTDEGAALWTPHVRGVSLKVRRAVRKYQQAIADLMAAADTRVCPAPALHRKHHWQSGVCLMCQRLDESLQSAHQDKLMVACHG